MTKSTARAPPTMAYILSGRITAPSPAKKPTIKRTTCMPTSETTMTMRRSFSM